LSYSRKDEGVVKALARGLEAAHREVWFDHDLVGGDAWWDSILTNIRDTSVFIFALSDASLHSKPCRLELDYALALDRPILPVEVGPVKSFRMSPIAELQVIRRHRSGSRAGRWDGPCSSGHGTGPGHNHERKDDASERNENFAQAP